MRRHAGLASILGIVLLSATANAQPIRLEQPTILHVSLPQGPDAAVAEFRVAFALQRDGQVYVAASPKPGNPACTGCEGPNTGWPTTVVLGRDATRQSLGVLDRDHPIQLGSLAANTTHVVHLVVHVPSGALSEAATHGLDYVLAYHTPATDQASGGSLDPSQAIHAVLVAESVASAKQVDGPSDDPSWPHVLVGLAALALIGLIVGVRMQSRKGRR